MFKLASVSPIHESSHLFQKSRDTLSIIKTFLLAIVYWCILPKTLFLPVDEYSPLEGAKMPPFPPLCPAALGARKKCSKINFFQHKNGSTQYVFGVADQDSGIGFPEMRNSRSCYCLVFFTQKKSSVILKSLITIPISVCRKIAPQTRKTWRIFFFFFQS